MLDFDDDLWLCDDGMTMVTALTPKREPNELGEQPACREPEIDRSEDIQDLDPEELEEPPSTQ